MHDSFRDDNFDPPIVFTRTPEVLRKLVLMELWPAEISSAEFWVGCCDVLACDDRIWRWFCTVTGS